MICWISTPMVWASFSLLQTIWVCFLKCQISVLPGFVFRWQIHITNTQTSLASVSASPACIFPSDSSGSRDKKLLNWLFPSTTGAIRWPDSHRVAHLWMRFSLVLPSQGGIAWKVCCSSLLSHWEGVINLKSNDLAKPQGKQLHSRAFEHAFCTQIVHVGG